MLIIIIIIIITGLGVRLELGFGPPHSKLANV